LIGKGGGEGYVEGRRLIINQGAGERENFFDRGKFVRRFSKPRGENDPWGGRRITGLRENCEESYHVTYFQGDKRGAEGPPSGGVGAAYEEKRRMEARGKILLRKVQTGYERFWGKKKICGEEHAFKRNEEKSQRKGKAQIIKGRVSRKGPEKTRKNTNSCKEKVKIRWGRLKIGKHPDQLFLEGKGVRPGPILIGREATQREAAYSSRGKDILFGKEQFFCQHDKGGRQCK